MGRFLIIITLAIICLNTTLKAQEQSATNRIDYNAEPKQYVIAELKAKGLQSLNPRLLLNTTGLAVGDTITIPSDKISSVTRRLMAQRHFSNIEVQTETNNTDSTVAITFLFDERIRVKSWNFKGTKGSDEKDITAALRLRKSSELTEFAIMSALEGIKKFYDQKGFRNAKTEVDITTDTLVKNYVNVTFNIERGKKVRIKEIVVQGADGELNPNKARRAMKDTKQLSINIFADTKFYQEKYNEDKNNLLGYFRSKGYRDARVIEDSLYMIPGKNNRMGVWVNVDKGQKYYLGEVKWIGNSKLPTAQLDQMLGLEKGEVYDSETLGRRLGTIMGEMGERSVSSLYQDDGYLAFAIKPMETVRGDTMDVEIRVIEGQQFTVNEVNFEGNFRTNDDVIRREIDTRPGELYSQSLLMRTYQRLASMGQFSTESFSVPQIEPDFLNETVNITYMLQEESRDQFELSGGWGGGMFIASVGVNFTNVSLRKIFDKNAWKPYPSGDKQTVSIQLQSNGAYYTSGAFSFTEPWLGGKKPISLTVGAYISKQTNALYWGDDITSYFQTAGASASIGTRLNWPDPFFILSGGITLQSYKMNDWYNFIINNGVSHVMALNFSFGRNSIDDPMGYPTRGSEITLSGAITPPWSLFDGVDYSQNMTAQEKYRWVEYYKINFKALWFTPLTPDNNLVLMTRAQFGYLGAFNKNKPSPFEGFQVGGDGLTGYSLYGVETIGLRGYENGALTPYSGYGQYASVYSKFTAELRYPFVRSSGTIVYGLVFAEAGNAFVNAQDYKPFNLQRSAGAGVRIYLPILGMLGVDWGYGFDSTPASPGVASGSQIHFTMGVPL